jgi:tRNA(fMet)-specific endonuclease VapC
MLRFLLDTDHLTFYQHKHPSLMRQIAVQPAGALGISPVTIEETLRGRLAILARPLTGPAHIQAYNHLVAAVQMFHLFPIVAFDQACENQFQQLYASRLRVGTHDLKIAAVALANNLTVLTRNRRDFGRIPGVKLDDWSV